MVLANSLCSVGSHNCSPAGVATGHSIKLIIVINYVDRSLTSFACFFNTFCLVLQGLPDIWMKMLQTSNISKTERMKNPQAVLQVCLDYSSNSLVE